MMDLMNMETLGNLGAILAGLATSIVAMALLSDHGYARNDDNRRLWDGCDFYRFFFAWIDDLKTFIEPRIKSRTSALAGILRAPNVQLHLRRGEEEDFWDVDTWIARELFRSTLKGFACGLALLLVFPLHMAIFLGVMMSCLFYLMQQVKLTQKSKLWQARFHQRLSFSIDLIALTMKAGSTIDRSLQAVLDENEGHPIGDEFKEIVQQHQNGTPLEECFDNFRRRMRDKDVNEVVFTAINAERYGGANADTYLRLADQMRIRRSQRAEKLIGEAKTMMALPNFLFLLSGALAIVGPFGLQMAEALGDFF